MSNSKDYVLIGEVLSTNGINGEVIVKLADNPLDITPKQVFIEINSNENIHRISYNIEYLKAKNSLEVILKIREATSAVQASFLKGEKIYISREEFVGPGLETLLQVK